MIKWFYLAAFVIFLTFVAWCVNDAREQIATMTYYRMHFDGRP